MEILKEQELFLVNGGGAKTGLILGIIGLTALLAGIIDGLLRPRKCNK